MRMEIERLEAVLPATELVGVLKNEITRLLNQVEQLQREVADAKRWAMQERTLRWHNLAAEGGLACQEKHMNGDPLDELDEAGEAVTRLQAEIERLRLTDAEREAVLDAALAYESDPDEWECAKIAATLRGLLERTGGER